MGAREGFESLRGLLQGTPAIVRRGLDLGGARQQKDGFTARVEESRTSRGVRWSDGRRL